MDQILHNLIGNVLQHTPEGTDLIITADCAEERLVIVLSDTGPGFPSADVDRVFEKFYRVEGSRPGGTGLGLSIVRGFAEAHGGIVTLRNLPLSGAEFTIEIPAEASYLSGLKNE
jgi:two-component system sensor histidine kinase KdpD